ncbi:hypothetical protein N7468_007767 [Penicillium chermesinum]|uniref:Uncharacterized protein n=1 Tax=Penicillium chermesinum TaxID=63820 RepID=A0A9W9NNI0_9EURO|nr:uncharacterized protein N7468_007767 [Penicillium chermesinum]KAJ5223225.1 hypothetical protein N7468_007767 [Penicillium chermesinum]
MSDNADGDFEVLAKNQIWFKEYNNANYKLVAQRYFADCGNFVHPPSSVRTLYGSAEDPTAAVGNPMYDGSTASANKDSNTTLFGICSI